LSFLSVVAALPSPDQATVRKEICGIHFFKIGGDPLKYDDIEEKQRGQKMIVMKNGHYHRHQLPPHCHSPTITRNGKKDNRKQNYPFKDCGRQFITGKYKIIPRFSS
jgi:hypothetical protein